MWRNGHTNSHSHLGAARCYHSIILQLRWRTEGSKCHSETVFSNNASVSDLRACLDNSKSTTWKSPNPHVWSVTEAIEQLLSAFFSDAHAELLYTLHRIAVPPKPTTMALSMRFMVLVNDPKVELTALINILCSVEPKPSVSRSCCYSQKRYLFLRTHRSHKKSTFFFYCPLNLNWFPPHSFWNSFAVCPCFHIHAFPFNPMTIC